jgi:hypothetical protein
LTTNTLDHGAGAAPLGLSVLSSQPAGGSTLDLQVLSSGNLAGVTANAPNTPQTALVVPAPTALPTLGDVTSTLDAGGAGAGVSVLGVTANTQSAAGTLATAPVVDAVTSIAAPVLAPVTAPATSAVAPITAPVTSVVTPVLAPVTSALTPVLAPVTSVTAPIAPAPVTTVTAPVTNLLGGLLGN